MRNRRVDEGEGGGLKGTRAESIATGDRHLLQLGTYEGIGIVTLAVFLEE